MGRAVAFDAAACDDAMHVAPTDKRGARAAALDAVHVAPRDKKAAKQWLLMLLMLLLVLCLLHSETRERKSSSS